MGSYVFADIPFNIRFEKGKKNYENFYSAEVHTDKNLITVCDFQDISFAGYGVEYVSEKYDKVLRSQNNPTSMMFVSDDWANVKICRGYNGQYSEELMITAVYSSLCNFNTVLLHASFVDLNGEGIVFTGPSGIGKTTQAQLWEKYIGATIVNGDKVFIRNVQGEALAYGTPWSGSSPYCLNKKSPLKGMVVLLQSDKNCIRRLNSDEAIKCVIPHIFMHHWDSVHIEKVLATFDMVLKNVSVWLLECKPDEEAVMITKEAILDNK